MIKIYIWTVQGKLPSGRAAATARRPTLATHSGVLTRHRTITDSVRGSIVVTIVKVILRRVSHLFFLRECLCFFTLTLNTSVINVHFLFWRVIFTPLRGQTKREVFMSSPFKEHLAANHSSYPMKEPKQYETKKQREEVHVQNRHKEMFSTIYIYIFFHKETCSVRHSSQMPIYLDSSPRTTSLWYASYMNWHIRD